MFDADLTSDLRRSFSAALEHDDPVQARSALVQAGWLDALAVDAVAAIALVFREQGRVGRDAAALDDVLATRLGISEVAVAYPAIPDAHIVLPAHRNATRLLWVPDLGGEALVVVDLDGALDAQPLGGIDPDAGFLGVAVQPAGSVTPVDAADWPGALTVGRVALAHQMVAGAQALLMLATAYARDRKQFGTPIASFQAVKHRLAETAVAIAAADASTLAAATTGSVTAGAVAKALAGRAAESAGRNCLQVFGGIGFTCEHDFHRNFRRSLVLDRLLGDRRTLERQLGAALRTGALTGEHLVDLADLPTHHDTLKRRPPGR